MSKGRWFVAALAVLCASAVLAASRHRSVRGIPPNDPGLSIVLTPVADGAPLHTNGIAGSLDLGAVSYAGARGDRSVAVEQHGSGYVVTTRFGLTINDPAARVQTATVTAYLLTPSRYVIRIDGKKLDPAPRVILAHVRVGRVSVHSIAVEVPNSVPADDNSVVNHPIQFAAIPE